ncbi:MAG: fructoselysine 6-kinase [Lachnospiraceae bacterium]|nr:fructoselysine 6-kinase [Lachnospiraceae bacterium]
MKIATVGDNCMDVYEQIGKAFPGGNPVNVAVYFKRYQHQISYIGAVGDDQYGTLIKDAITLKGIDTSRMKVLPGKTAVTIVELEQNNRIFKDYDEGVLKDIVLSEDDICFLQGQDLVVSSIWSHIEQYLPKIRSGQNLIAFDFSTERDNPIIDMALPYVDYAFFAFDEDDEETRKFICKRQAQGAKCVVATLGSNGSIVYDGNHYYKYGIISCNVVDTMGAGDSYITGFLDGILRGLSITECMQEGAKNSSITIGYNGAW